MPEAQLDRFLMKILVLYPSREDLSRIVDRTLHRDESTLEQVIDRDAILQLKSACRDVLVAEHVQEFAINLVMATQPGNQVCARSGQQIYPLRQLAARRSGAGGMRPRACIDAQRLNLSIDDVREIAPAVLRHRIILNFDAHADGQTPETILTQIIENVSAAAVL